jgi:proline dehydrogenase
MGLDISRDFCFSNVTKICHRAGERGNFVRIDMEGSPYTQETLSLFLKLHELFKNVGIVVQAYLRRSEEDLRQINAAGARVRLCKGAYKEPVQIAYQKMPEIRENFKRLAQMLFAQGNYPAMATHDDELIGWSKEYVRQHRVGRDQFEFQMLYGVRPETQRTLARQGYRVRVYVPFGTHWLPYFSRRLRERKENVFFILRNFFKD